MATKESVLTGLEPRSFWGHFEALTQIARPSRLEEPAIEHVREWADRHGFELAAGRRPEPRRPRSGDSRPRGRADGRAPGAPGHRLRARSFEPERPGGGAHRARPRRRVADRGRDDARRRRRRRDRGDDGAGRGRVAAARAARAADDGGRGGRARGRERARPRARDGLDPDQPRQRGGREADGGVRRQHRHLDPDRGAAGAAGRRCGDACRHGERRVRAATPGRESRWGGRTRSRCSGGLCARRSTTVPFRLVSLSGGKSRNAIPRDAIAVCSVAGDSEQAFRDALATAAETIRDAFAKTDAGVSIDVAAVEGSADPWTDAGTASLLDAVALVPTGPLALSPDFDDLVETSTSLGEATTEGDQLTLHSLSRSSNDSALPDVIATLDAAARLAGGTLEVKHNYRRVASGSRLARPRLGEGRVRAPLRSASDRDGGARRAGDRGHRRQGVRRSRHALVRPSDRVSAFARRAG